MNIMKTILLLLALSVGLAACGIKGDPERPSAAQKAQ
jgi:predicted small lipoprotein YifL